jgi:hypothetical protein
LIYIVFVFLIVLNVVFFPELLNHKDIKLNDLSYLVTNNNFNEGNYSIAINNEKEKEENKVLNLLKIGNFNHQ